MSKTRSATPRATAGNKPASAAPADASAPAAGCTQGVVLGLAEAGACWVTYAGNPGDQARRARILRHVGEVQPGQTVLLQFLGSDPTQPVVVGVMTAQTVKQDADAQENQASAEPLKNIEIDGQTLTLAARERLVLRVGRASLVMQADGTIELRGVDVTSRAAGQNAIRGAAVTLN